MSLDIGNGVEDPGGAQIGREDLREWVRTCRQLREFLELHIAEMDRARQRRRLVRLFFAAFLVTSVVLCWAWRGVGRPHGDDHWGPIDTISVRYGSEAEGVGPACFRE